MEKRGWAFPQSFYVLFTFNSCCVLGLICPTLQCFLLLLLTLRTLALGRPGNPSDSIAPHKTLSPVSIPLSALYPLTSAKSSTMCVTSPFHLLDTQLSVCIAAFMSSSPALSRGERAISFLPSLCSLTLLLLHGSEIFKGESAHGGPPKGVGLHDGLQPRPVQRKEKKEWIRMSPAGDTGTEERRLWPCLAGCQRPLKGHLGICEFLKWVFPHRCWPRE